MRKISPHSSHLCRFTFGSFGSSLMLAACILGAHPTLTSAAEPYARAGWKATLSTRGHGVSGKVTIVDEDTFRVDNFYYDGGGVNVHFIVAPNAASFTTNRIVTERNFLGSRFTGGSVAVDLPAGRTFDGQNTISLWCIPYASDFGSGTFAAPGPEDLIPSLTLTTPTASFSTTASTVTSDLQVKGTADDLGGVAKVQVQVNGGSWADVPIVATPISSRPALVSFDVTVPDALTNIYIPNTPNNTNIVKVRAVDTDGNYSTEAISTVRLIVKAPLTVAVSGSSATRLLTGLSTTGYEVGKTYTLTAKQFDATTVSDTTNVFSQWTGAGVSSSAPTLTFTMSTALVTSPSLTASYIPTPFPRAKIGRFDGLIRSASGSTVSNDTHGFITTTITPTGTYTGTLAIAGRRHSIKGTISNSGAATVDISRATAKLPNLSLTFSVDLAGTTNRLTGSVSDGINTSTILADRASYSTTSPVPASYLNAKSKGFYTFALPSKAQASLTTSQFTQGDSVGTITISPAGVVTGDVILADGRTSTSVALISTVLSKDHTFPLFGALYTVGTLTRGSISGLVKLDDTQPSTDLTGTDILWFRPADLPGTTRYTSGWPNGAVLDLQGAKYNVVKGTSVLPNLPATASSTLPNADLTFSDGPLSNTITKTVNVSTANAVRVTPADRTVTLAITSSTGAFSGKITPAGSTALDYRGVILQKGTNAGGYGYVLGTSEAGGVSLLHE